MHNRNGVYSFFCRCNFSLLILVQTKPKGKYTDIDYDTLLYNVVQQFLTSQFTLFRQLIFKFYLLRNSTESFGFQYAWTSLDLWFSRLSFTVILAHKRVKFSLKFSNSPLRLSEERNAEYKQCNRLPYNKNNHAMICLALERKQRGGEQFWQRKATNRPPIQILRMRFNHKMVQPEIGTFDNSNYYPTQLDTQYFPSLCILLH